jgi:hypothetical protein
VCASGRSSFVHARTLGDAVKHHQHPATVLRESLAETWPILAASSLFNWSAEQSLPAAWTAVIVSAALLTGLGPIGSLVSAALGALLGLSVIALKASLH